MQKLGKELEFISLVQRDGSGVILIGTPWSTSSKHPKTDDMSYLDDDKFEVTIISMTNQTYIASGFNTFVVKLKPETNKMKTPIIHFYEEMEKRLHEKDGDEPTLKMVLDRCSAYFTKSEEEYFNNLYNANEN